MHPATQSTQEPSWPPSGWLTKQQAAERLNLSTSRVFALGEAGIIKTQRFKSPTSGQFVAIFHSGDIERVIYERENPDKLPAKLDKPIAVSPQYSEKWYGIKPIEPRQKPWITISQAADYTGLPVSNILKGVESGEIPARDVGPRPGGRWRVKRSDLDALEGQR